MRAAPETRVVRSSSSRLLPASFFQRDTEQVARALIGAVLCRRLPDGRILRGEITETEAYLGVDDAACHTFGGRRTERVKSMYAAGGHAYVYFIYGMHFCFNVVTQGKDCPEAVLVRGIRMLEDGFPPTDGPAKLCKVMSIGRAEDGLRLWTRADGIWIEQGFSGHPPLHVSARIGVAYAGADALLPLRFENAELRKTKKARVLGR